MARTRIGGKCGMIINGDCLEEMRKMEENSVDSIVTDPPYGLGFMGKDWDAGVPGKQFWIEALRVAKPGAHLISFGGSRTWHRLACAIEDAGWELRDNLAWVYASGMPKGQNISKALEKAAGKEVSSEGYVPNGKNNTHGKGWGCGHKTSEFEPTEELAKKYNGWNTTLKPCFEPIILARKPLCGTVVQNVKEYGTGGINIDACRVGTEPSGWNGLTASREGSAWDSSGFKGTDEDPEVAVGRWPGNFLHDGSEEVTNLFPYTSKGKASMRGLRVGGEIYGSGKGASGPNTLRGHDDEGGSAARFFYCSKASRLDRDEGCDQIEARNNMRVNAPRNSEEEKHATIRHNYHVSVKPFSLMEWLVKLVTPDGGVVLDPFCGSGSTGKAAVANGFEFIGIDLDEGYCEIARKRVAFAKGLLA